MTETSGMFGRKFVGAAELETPSCRTALVVTVWILPDGAPPPQVVQRNQRASVGARDPQRSDSASCDGVDTPRRRAASPMSCSVCTELVCDHRGPRCAEG